jgi:ABC-type multidrug transport system fused ATPase/permease subunit
LPRILFRDSTFLYHFVNVQGTHTPRHVPHYSLFHTFVYTLHSVVFRKSLRLASYSHTWSEGYVLNLLGKDSGLAAQAVLTVPTVVVGLLSIMSTLYLLYDTIGEACFAGLLTLVVAFPLVVVSMKTARKYTVAAMKFADERLKFVNEVLQGIRVIKFYAWEKSFMQKIGVVREQELRKVRGMALLVTSNIMIFTIVPVGVQFVSFWVYSVLIGREMEPVVMFKAIALFNTLQMPMIQIPGSIIAIVGSARVFKA